MQPRLLLTCLSGKLGYWPTFAIRPVSVPMISRRARECLLTTGSRMYMTD
jgi:hypothetical protein